MVSPRPPRQDGQGDQRRAHYALTGLSADWAVDVVSWLPDADDSPPHRWPTSPARLARAVALSMVRPIQVAYVQSLAPRSLVRGLADYDAVLFMTDRAVPRAVRHPYTVDFIDDMGGAAARRASSSGPLAALFWRWEGRRLRSFDAKLAAGAVLSVAVNEHDAAAISPRVLTIPPAIGTRPMPDTGTKVVFTGNLFYSPNTDAAIWICTSLVPRLRDRGLDPGDVVIAGRRPPASLRAEATSAGVDLRADVPDLTEVLGDAAVVIAPVTLGSGVQNKVLDAIGAGRACVVTPFTNRVLGLVDGHSALVRERTADAFADAILSLLHDPPLRRRLADEALTQLAGYRESAVAESWRRCFAGLREELLERPSPLDRRAR